MQNPYESDEKLHLLDQVNKLFVELSQLVGKVTAIAIMRSALRKSTKIDPTLSVLTVNAETSQASILEVNQSPDSPDADSFDVTELATGLTLYIETVANILNSLTGEIMLSILDQAFADAYAVLDKIKLKGDNGEP